MNEQQCSIPEAKILFCTDFSENADIAFQYALGMALRRPGAVLIILHVIPEPEAQFWRTYIYELENIDEKAKQDVDQQIAQSYLSKIPSEVSVRIEIRIGRDYQTIWSLHKKKR
jgi:hypothetical protein